MAADDELMAPADAQPDAPHGDSAVEAEPRPAINVDDEHLTARLEIQPRKTWKSHGSIGESTALELDKHINFDDRDIATDVLNE